jgi:hypothetical protein
MSETWVVFKKLNKVSPQIYHRFTFIEQEFHFFPQKTQISISTNLANIELHWCILCRILKLHFLKFVSYAVFVRHQPSFLQTMPGKPKMFTSRRKLSNVVTIRFLKKAHAFQAEFWISSVIITKVKVSFH